MKRLLILLAIVTSVTSQAQTIRANKIIADKSIYLRNAWIDSVLNDTTGLSGKIKSILTAKAVYDFVTGRISSITIPPGSSHGDSILVLYGIVYPESNIGEGLPLHFPNATGDSLLHRTASDGNGTEVDTLPDRSITYNLGGTLKKTTSINTAIHDFFLGGNGYTSISGESVAFLNNYITGMQAIGGNAQVIGQDQVTLSGGGNSVSVLPDSATVNKPFVFLGSSLPTSPNAFMPKKYIDSLMKITVIGGYRKTGTDSIFLKYYDGSESFAWKDTLSTGSGTTASGTYTPTLTNTTNISSSTAILCHYTLVGNQVHVQGSVTLTATGSGAFQLNLSLPPDYATTFAAATDLSGVGSKKHTTADATFNCYFEADTTNEVAALKGAAAGAGTATFFFSFMYTYTPL